MLWRGQRESGNVVDRRAIGAAGLGGAGLVIAVLYFFLTGDPGALVNEASVTINQPGASGQRVGGEGAGSEDDQRAFVRVVLADTEDVWHRMFEKMGRTYEEPMLVLFSGRVKSACGLASAAVGPFYCPVDRQIYLDLSFFADLQNRLGASGDFARAYVVAHEVGHHVQNLLGIRKHSNSAKDSVGLELQADCFAGVWTKQLEATKDVIQAGDVQEALDAATAVGDDRLQMKAQGYVVPDSFTHGASKERVAWFTRGYDRGRVEDCNSFRE